MSDAAAHVEAWEAKICSVRGRSISLAWLVFLLDASEEAKRAAEVAELRLNDTMDRADRLGSVDLCLTSLQRRDRARLSAAMGRLGWISEMLEEACRLHARESV